MSISQADRFEQHVNNQLSKSLGAIPVLYPILRRLRVAQAINHRCAGGEEVSHGTTVEILTLNRLIAENRVDGLCVGTCMGWLSRGFPCLGFSRLNDRGIPAACDGDMDSLLTMLIFQHALNESDVTHCDGGRLANLVESERGPPRGNAAAPLSFRWSGARRAPGDSE